MNKLRKIFLWLIGICIVFLLAISYLAPKLINSRILKGKIESVASQKIGGDVQFQSLDLSIFPRPHAIIRHGNITTEKASGSLVSLTLYPEVLPLFTGKLQISKLLFESPDIQMSLPSYANKTQNKVAVPLKEIMKKVVVFMSAPLIMDHPDLVVVMENGNLNIIKDNESVFSLGDIYSQVVFPPAGHKGIKAEGKSSMLKLLVQQENNKLVVKSSSLQGSFYYDEDKTSISLSELILDYPQLKVTGELNINNKSKQISLSLDGREVEVEPTREAVLAMAGDIPVTQEIFKIVKGGNIPSISFNSQASSFEGLKEIKNIIIKGSMNDGEIFIPKARLNLKAVNGNVVISNGILEGKNIKARLGNSQGHDGYLKLGLKGKDAPFHLDMMVQADLSELPPLLKGLIKSKTLVKELAFIDKPKGKAYGKLVLGESLKSIKTRVEASDVNLSARYKRFPYPIELNTEHFYYDESGISVKNLRGKTGKSFFSDITFQMSLKKKSFLKISSGKALIFMDETYPWFSKLTGLPSKSHLRSPLSVTHISMVWDRGEKTLFKGSLSLQNVQEISFDITRSPGELRIKDLNVKDESSEANIGLNIKDAEIDIKFNGHLDQSTVNKIVSDNRIINGWLKGDFQTQILRDQPTHSTAQGRLEGKDIVLPLKLNEPLNIKNVSLDAAKSHIKVVSADMTLGKSNAHLTGDVEASKEGFIFNIDLSTNKLEWDSLRNAFVVEKKEKDTKYFYDFPVKGTIRLNSESLAYGQFILEPFRADIAIDPDNIKIAVIESDLCGISIPGNLKLTPLNLLFEFKPVADNKELEPAIECLFGIRKRMTGLFGFRGTIKGKGGNEEIINSLTGNLEFSAKDGRIYRGGLLAKILAFINVTEIFRGKVPDLVKKGFAYKSITANGSLNGVTLTLKEAIIDGSSMKIVSQGDINLKEKRVDLKVFVAPLKIADFIIEKVPLLKNITGKNILSIPLKVTGDLEDPKITYF